jgi:hypothetical protein
VILLGGWPETGTLHKHALPLQDSTLDYKRDFFTRFTIKRKRTHLCIFMEAGMHVNMLAPRSVQKLIETEFKQINLSPWQCATCGLAAHVQVIISL